MVAYFTVLGSCASRDIFNSQVNKDYKKYFKIGEDGFRLTMVSLMLDPVEYSDSLKIYPESKMNERYSNWIKKDLEKRFLIALKENNFEYLVLDTYFDVSWGLIDIGDGNYITKNQHIEETEFFKNLKFKRFVTIQKDTEEYLTLWKQCCDSFFKFMDENCPDTKIILNPNRHVHNYIGSDKKIKKSEKFQFQCSYNNHYRDILDKYIVENFDVDVLEFDVEKIFADEDHFWSFYSLHYIEDYFTNANSQLNEIIYRNNLFKNCEYDVNAEIRKYKREAFLEKMNRNLLLNSLSKFSKARIDIKNFGENDNNLVIIDNSDIYSNEFRPGWFNNKDGGGVIVESYNGSIDLKIQCIKDGILRLSLKGIDFKDVNGYRFQIYIDFTKLTINDEVLIDGNTLTCHDKPKIFTKNVKNNEIIDVHVEWQPFNHDSNYLEIGGDSNLKSKKFKFNKKYAHIKNSKINRFF